MRADTERGPGARLWTAVVATGLAIAVIVVFMSGDGGGNAGDPSGDTRYVKGKQPRRTGGFQIAPSIADAVQADVRRERAGLVFEATAASAIPRELERGSLEYRFDISEDGRDTWIVSATVNVAATAAVVSRVTGYGSFTIDDSMPGSVEVLGEAIRITLWPHEIEGFPEKFDWALSSNLTAFRDIPGSTRVEDRVPDEGTAPGP